MLSEQSTFEAFLEAAKGKRVVGFAAALAVNEISALLSEHGMKFEYIVDNDMWKWGSEISGIPICSPGKLYDEKPGEFVVLICNQRPFEVETQLNTMGIKECYAYFLWVELIYRRTGRGSTIIYRMVKGA